ncbi:MAG: hypothetical protein LAT52_07675 [Balneolales bacterium]|nr:hypothetical protein [Balneolales bacterium]
MNYFEYIWVWILSILAIAIIVWIVLSPVNTLRELNALPVIVYQVEGDVYTRQGLQLSRGDTVQVGTSFTGRDDSQLILKLSERSFIHFGGAFSAGYHRVEGYRLPIFELAAGWMNIKRHISDVRVAGAFQTPVGNLTTSPDASSWLVYPYNEIYTKVTSENVHILVPNGPIRWTEEEGSTTIRSGSKLVVSRFSSQRQLTEMPAAVQIVSPEDDGPTYFPGDLVRGYTITWRSTEPTLQYMVRIAKSDNLLPYFQHMSEEPAYTVSGLPEGTYTISIGSVHHSFGVSRWSDGFRFTVSGRVNDTLDCSITNNYASYTQIRGQTYIYGCVPNTDTPLHVGVFSRGDVWYLQSATGLRGAIPAEDGYWEISVTESSQYRVVINPLDIVFESVTANINQANALFVEEIDISQ